MDGNDFLIIIPIMLKTSNFLSRTGLSIFFIRIDLHIFIAYMIYHQITNIQIDQVKKGKEWCNTISIYLSKLEIML